MTILEQMFGKFERKRYLPTCLGLILVIAVPCIHLGIINRLVFYSTDQYKPEVDVLNCANTCWDSKYKGVYESIPSGYKHVYFNSTMNTVQIWIITIVFVVAFYETVKRIVKLYMKRRLRYIMVVLFCSVLYSHYYTWWSLFNYLNDDFYDQWYHQLYFSFTELVSTICVVFLMNQENYLQPKLLLVILDIALFHILVSGRDQFLANVFQQSGQAYQVLRDLGFMVPDIFHVVIPTILLWHWKENKRLMSQRSPMSFNDNSAFSIYTLTRQDVMVSIGSVVVMSIIGLLL